VGSSEARVGCAARCRWVSVTGLTRVMSLLTKLGCRLEAVVIATNHRLVPVGPIAEAAVEKDRLHRSGSPKPSLASPRPAWSWLELPVALILARLRFVPQSP